MDAPVPTLTPSPLPEDALIIVAVREAVLFPGAVIPLAATRPVTTEALQIAARESRHVAVVLQRDPATDQPGLADLHAVGTEARLLR